MGKRKRKTRTTSTRATARKRSRRGNAAHFTPSSDTLDEAAPADWRAGPGLDESFDALDEWDDDRFGSDWDLELEEYALRAQRDDD